MSKYVITDGKRWIMKDSKGRYVPTSCGSFALEFSKRQADTIFLNQLAKPLRSCFRVEKVDEHESKIGRASCRERV